MSNAKLTIFQLFELFMKMYGQDFLYFTVAAVVVLIVLIKLLYKKDINLNIFTFSFIFVFLLILMFVCFSGVLGIDYTREMRYVIFAATILVGLGLYKLFFSTKYKKAVKTFVIILLILSTSISIFNTFPSPITKDSNPQVTQMELTGVNWFLNHRNISMSGETINTPSIVRMIDEIRGEEFNKFNVDLHSTVINFNYTNHSNYGESLNSSKKDVYFLNMKFWQIFYPNVYPEYEDQWKYTPYDFYRLDHNDDSVNEVYSNGEFWIYYVNKINSTNG
ncbi:MAG: hypothetical protein K8E24_015665 [Methanobacterium paludis]|nr:hypothetical protein [Methanobacterium paludis]